MVKNMLPGNQKLICFIDNDKAKQESAFCGTPVISPSQITEERIEKIWIAVLNKEAASEIKILLADMNFKCEILDIQYFIQNHNLRLAGIRLAAKQISEREVEGDVAELGVYKGDIAAELNSLFPGRKLCLFDTFERLAERDVETEKRVAGGTQKYFTRDFKDTSENYVLKRLPHPENAVICKGYFPESLSNIEMPERFAFVSLDPDLYAPVKSGLEIFYPLMSKGGVIHIHDYNSFQFPGVKRAVDEYCIQNNLFIIPITNFHGSAMLVKS